MMTTIDARQFKAHCGPARDVATRRHSWFHAVSKRNSREIPRETVYTDVIDAPRWARHRQTRENIMNRKAIGLGVLTLALAAAGPAWAHGTGFHHRHGHHGHRSGVGIGIVIGAGMAAAAYSTYPRYHYTPRYYSPPVYYYPAPVVVSPPAPPVYIEQQAAAPVQQAQPSGYWYYCNNPQGYYPSVQDCPQGWQKVLPRPSSAQ
jgi:hypothetical protein